MSHFKMDRWLEDCAKIEDASTETFELFSEVDSGQDLGILAPKERSLDVSVSQHDFTIVQSPALLQSSRSEGTTGAVLWRTSLLLAQWLSQPSNILCTSGLLQAGNVALELGAGSAGITAAILATKLAKTGRVIATDIGPVTRLLQQNVTSHLDTLSRGRSTAGRKANRAELADVTVVNLNWEHDDARSLLASCAIHTGVDIVLACDCVYNYALIKPFLDTCKDICSIRSSLALESAENGIVPTICLVVQQLRQPEVFEEWLEAALLDFEVWRMPSSLTGQDLRVTKGYALHILRLKPD